MTLRRLTALLVCAMMLLLPCLAEENPDDGMILFGYQERVAGFAPDETCAVRALYSISLPEKDVHEAVLEAYRGYERVLLIEYAVGMLPPVVQSQFVCVGRAADGTLSILPTPFDIAARTYDYGVFGNVTIEVVK